MILGEETEKINKDLLIIDESKENKQMSRDKE